MFAILPRRFQHTSPCLNIRADKAPEQSYSEQLRPQTTSHVALCSWGAQLALSPREDSPYSLQLFNRLPLPIGSSCHILTMSRSQSSPEFPSQHPAVAHRAGHTNHSILLSYNMEPAAGRPEAPASTSDWQVRLKALIGQRVLSDISNSLKVRVWWRDTL